MPKDWIIHSTRDELRKGKHQEPDHHLATQVSTLVLPLSQNNYRLRPMINVLLEFNFFLKISKHLHIRQHNFICLFLLFRFPKYNDCIFLEVYL